ncbi:MAG: hypothetical protein JWN99_2348 [Ilumatobacteraceae bacterium]|nr:hypothetical protein [Ilumatobacteraceae bacterium]
MSLSSSTRTDSASPSGGRALLNKVPEVTIWFWVIKILCTTVGESFADWISVDQGVGLVNTALIFTVVLAAALAWQIRLPKYNAFAYWTTVVVLSVTGTLYTDILTDKYHVSLALTTPLFAALLAVVFGIWYRREHTLSIHSIVTIPREAFYWLAILVTFALGTAAGDWTLELTGWTPGVSVLLPVFLIVSIVICWRLGANPVLSFWLAYVLTRPLGANLGDWLALSKGEGGLNLGTAGTSVVFLGAILATVTYLAIKRPDVIEKQSGHQTETGSRERVMYGYYVAVAVVAVIVLVVANSRPHTHVSAEEADGGGAPVVQLSPQQATANFPAADLSQLRTISQDTLNLVASGDQSAAATKVTDLETAWDDAQGRLEPLDETAWTFYDSEIDAVLTAVRASNPDTATEKQALGALVTSLTP